MTELPLLVVTVGSDHHRFDRLIGWIDGWLGDGGADRVRCIAQHGTARPPKHAEAHDYLEHDLLMDLVGSATVLVTQGGPMGIVEARRHGIVPIAVPRRRALAEVVDDHQVDFCRQLARDGQLLLAEDERALRAALERVLAEPHAVRVPPEATETGVQEAVDRFDALVNDLAAQRHAPRRGGRLAG